jgi:hypothetical protein
MPGGGHRALIDSLWGVSIMNPRSKIKGHYYKKQAFLLMLYLNKILNMKISRFYVTTCVCRAISSKTDETFRH